MADVVAETSHDVERARDHPECIVDLNSRDPSRMAVGGDDCDFGRSFSSYPPCAALQVRQLCSKQFMARALGLKVAARQHSLLRTRPAYGRQQPGPGTGPANGTLPLHLGDAWANTGMLANPLAG